MGQMGAAGWETVGAVIAVVAPLVGAPLTMITFYLRSLHQQQTVKHAETVRRIERIEQSVGGISESLNDFERDYTTKEEWLRESMHARQQLERLLERMAEVQVKLDGAHALATEFRHAARAMIRLSQAYVPSARDDAAAGAADGETT